MQWVTKSEACSRHGFTDALFDDLVAAGVLTPVRFGHRTVKFSALKVKAAASLLPEITALLERLSREKLERHEAP